ncbi:MAG: hypothetical protein JWO37_39 [Acidimicrobiales bacterium]|jgi:hypothetical protein|nr:hypothetical protein [Acidimicrobiales bacterium]
MGQTMAGGRADRLRRRPLRALVSLVSLALAGTGGVAGLAPGRAAAAVQPLSASISVDRAEVKVTPGSGEASPTLTYRIEISASPDGDAAVPGVQVVDELPAGVTPKAQDSTSPASIDGRRVTWTVGDMGYSVWRATLTVTVDDPASITGPLRNSVVATGSDGTRAEATPAETAVVVVDDSTSRTIPTTAPPQVLGDVITRSAPVRAPAVVHAAPAAPALPFTGRPIFPQLALALMAMGVGGLCVRFSRSEA